MALNKAPDRLKHPTGPATLSWLDEREETSGVSGLPLFEWAERAPVSVGRAAARKDVTGG
jgi:hypothetical protein